MTQPAERHTVDTITSNALDQLYAEVATVRGQMRLLDAMRQSHMDAACAAVQRAERAEAAIERVRAECMATLESRHSHQFRRDQCERILAALDPQEPQP
ncbi:hypothetical protein ABZ135_38780 [Streptomyces sp. NPDC006339]|uniref:hypothetical protein n=1 Tax=Streptomyces sp. NPDC006339 TaxID=3156755 RepID=UPI0033BC8602